MAHRGAIVRHRITDKESRARSREGSGDAFLRPIGGRYGLLRLTSRAGDRISDIRKRLGVGGEIVASGTRVNPRTKRNARAKRRRILALDRKSPPFAKRAKDEAPS